MTRVLIVFAVGILSLPPEGLEDIVGPASVIDGDTVLVNEQTIRLWGIEAPDLDQSCQDASGAEWPCGLYAKQILARLVGASTIHCKPQGLTEDRILVALCTVDGRDLAWAMVAFGFAIDVPDISGGAYRAPQSQSAAVRAGIWSGTMDGAAR